MLWRIADFFESLRGYARILIFAVSLWVQGYRVMLRRQRFYSAHFGWYASLMIDVSKRGQHIATYDECMFKLCKAKSLIRDVLKGDGHAAKEPVEA